MNECDYKLTQTPVFFENKENGNKYVLFGDWPQTLKDENIIIEKDVIYNINGWKCYKGSDNCYYVAEKATPYVKSFFFNNGECIENKVTYYFKMESIKWRMLSQNFQGGKLILSENVIFPNAYDFHYNEFLEKSVIREIEGQKVYPSNYKYSYIRAFLNGLDGKSYDVDDFTDNGFIDKAFSKKAISLIKTTKIDNNKESILGRNENSQGYDTSRYVCSDTEDKVFLLSKVEVTNAEYGFGDCFERYINPNRIKSATDYALAKGAFSDICDGEGMTWWWLRSPIYDIRSGCAAIVSVDGDAFSIGFVNHSQGGIVPAIVIK